MIITLHSTIYNSKNLIQDTSESIAAHMLKGFSPDPLIAYLEFWGIMQALIIQQDAISELSKSLIGSDPQIPLGSAWSEIRNLRNICAGHPAKKTGKKTDPHYRTFMGRNFGNYDSLTYELFDSTKQTSTHPKVNLRKMIGEYDVQASGYLNAAFNELKKSCP